ncbi:hypothetical protein TD95_004061 [Thielaviopsis punctulata]|uniref:Major facilitator superfamily (MFS) profile domain-containing protein n=1 Tax=Thielaviopsis punctulata TaxID=72032 RepID=A0A0F4Z9F4_9PEZI|nr:hypothetical protein TD95_004061 [Thielaviopsis punctulata]
MVRRLGDDEQPLLSDIESSSTLNDADDAPLAVDGDGGDNNDDDVGVPMSRRRVLVIMLSMWALIFLQSSNMSGITMLQSRIAEDLDADEHVTWFAGVYLIALSAVSPLFGRLATIFPPRNMILPVSLTVALGSGLTATAPSLSVFLAGRVVTGLGGAGVMTLSMVFVLALSSKKRRGLFLALANVGFTIGLSFGAVVFGAVVGWAGWRTIFWAQVPVALGGGVVLFASVPPQTKNDKKASAKGTWEKVKTIDYPGAALMCLTISLLLYALAGTVRPLVLTAALVALAGFVAWEYRWATDPVIPLHVLSSRSVLFSCFAQLIFVSARWTLLYYGPIFMLAVKGLSPSSAGSILIPTNFGYGGGGLLIGSLHIRRGGSFWLPSVAAYVLFCVTLVGVAAVAAGGGPQWVFVAAVFANGLATGGGMNYSFAHMLHVSAPSVHFITTSLLGTFRGFGGSFGTAIGGGYFLRLLADKMAREFARLDGGAELSPERRDLITRLAGRPGAVFAGDLTAAETEIARGAYADALARLWMMAAGLGVCAVLLQALCGWNEAGEGDGEQPATVSESEEEEAAAGLLAAEGARED